ncbi:GNAT family N-acetyltransferase, partial [bacterium]|nr:GNAT family N-acetyltransferase [bacterium]
SVLKWNAPAIGFYERLGAVPMEEWQVYRLTGGPLHALADGARPGAETA